MPVDDCSGVREALAAHKQTADHVASSGKGGAIRKPFWTERWVDVWGFEEFCLNRSITWKAWVFFLIRSHSLPCFL